MPPHEYRGRGLGTLREGSARAVLIALSVAVVAITLVAAHRPHAAAPAPTAVDHARLAATGSQPAHQPLAHRSIGHQSRAHRSPAHRSPGHAARRTAGVPADCLHPATTQFVPTSVTISGLIQDAPVLALPRDASNHPGVAPVDEAGMHEFAWDQPPGLMPGTVGGNVLLNAHTWPWGSAPALGNRMLLGLHIGDVIRVAGSTDHLCYRVTDRVQQPADSSFARYYSAVGPPQLAIMVCSGVRRGPEDWADRTVWFASPIAG